jgi:hypothetical protein
MGIRLGVIVYLTELPPIMHRTGSFFISYLSYYTFGAFLAANYEKFGKILSLHRTTKVWGITLWSFIFGLWVVSGGYYVYINYISNVQKVAVNTQVFEIVWFVYLMMSFLALFQLAKWLYVVMPSFLRNLTVNLGISLFGVYFIHPLVLNLYRHIPLSGNGFTFFLFFLGEFFISLVLSWVLTNLLMKNFSWSWVLFGSSIKKIKAPSHSL